MRNPSRITWHKHGGNLNRRSDCGRWLISHPKNTPYERWTLYDLRSDDPWQGDWPTLTSAKAAAERRAAIEPCVTPTAPSTNGD